MKNGTEIIRELIHTDEFDEYFSSLDERVKDKKDYKKQVKKAINILNALDYDTEIRS